MEEEVSLIYVEYVGMDRSTDLHMYNFLFSTNPKIVWGENWEVTPAGLCNSLLPDQAYYEKKLVLRSAILFNTADKNTCFSMQDCTDGIIALAWENIDSYTEAPEDRLVFKFGEPFKSVDDKLGMRHQLFLNENCFNQL